MSIKDTENWFKKAKPAPTGADLNTQISCHTEEFGEMLAALKGVAGVDEYMIKQLREEVALFTLALRTGNIRVQISDRKEFLDALADQVVTATGCAYMAGMNLPEALERVNASNLSKFDANGNPVFDENGKIVKNKATYVQPDLSGLF